jgi:hypothetical protein
MGLQPTVVNLAINKVNRLAFAPAKGLTSRCPAGHGKGKRQGYQTSFDYQGGKALFYNPGVKARHKPWISPEGGTFITNEVCDKDKSEEGSLGESFFGNDKGRRKHTSELGRTFVIKSNLRILL